MPVFAGRFVCVSVPVPVPAPVIVIVRMLRVRRVGAALGFERCQFLAHLELHAFDRTHHLLAIGSKAVLCVGRRQNSGQ